VLFPFAGVDFNINLSAKDKKSGDDLYEDGEYGQDPDGNDYTRAGVETSLKILFGVGLDFGFTDTMFFRAEAAYGIDLLTTEMNDMIKYFNDNGGKVKATGGMIPIKLAVGFRF